MKRKEITVTAKIINSRPTAIQFVLEPWGDFCDMRSEAIFDVVARGPEGGALEFEVGEDFVAVYGWAGSVAYVYHNDAQILEGSVPVPSSKESELAETAG